MLAVWEDIFFSQIYDASMIPRGCILRYCVILFLVFSLEAISYRHNVALHLLCRSDSHVSDFVFATPYFAYVILFLFCDNFCNADTLHKYLYFLRECSSSACFCHVWL